MVLYTTEDLNFSNLFRVAVTAAATTIVVSANALAFVVDIFFFIWPTPSKVASKLTLCFLYILCRFLFYGNSHFTRKQSEQRMRERKRKRKTTFQSQHSLWTVDEDHWKFFVVCMFCNSTQKVLDDFDEKKFAENEDNTKDKVK